MHEAAARARRKGLPIIDCNVAEGCEFLFALHKNDAVSANSDGQRTIYRVQDLEKDSQRIALQANCSAKNVNSSDKLRRVISVLINRYEMEPLHIDVLGAIRKR